MKLIVNGEPVQTDRVVLADLLEQLGYGNIVVATAVNGSFVPVPRRNETSLEEGDKVEILAPMQGG
ncbi:MAG TPA: sulfur carrier protein ThiS [Geminicoccus sp.]|jgi:sulfur carrier protein|uniref:sulfur carrier protein ThiS n=1 Tax=Geminicoccus sp. TaxID=2024832 RepID=UPI002E31E22B|nr:sulfur carrier protein ThiS [Geminicoccus sp.]HEX2529649.1 sulfur carrier protein ThiS [Geminicoccus sp.]